MKKIRIGNDILIRWTINREDKPEVFPSSTAIYLEDENRKKVTAEVSLSDNVATILYRGKNQCNTGIYRLLLIENGGMDGMVSLDHSPAFELVPESRMAGGYDDRIVTETVELTDTIETHHGFANRDYISLERLGAYLYKVTFDSIPEYRELNIPAGGGCSSFVSNGKLYRNLDWNYDETNEFLVVTKDFNGMSFIGGIEDGRMDDSLIGQLPYHVNDGVNRYGIMVSSHVLYDDFGHTYTGGTNITKLPYIILTTLHSMDDIGGLSDILDDIKIPTALSSQEYLMQFVVTDGTTTCVIEPSADGYEITEITSNPKLTNFKWVNRSIVNRTDADIQLRPTGIERWNAIDNNGLEDLRFTMAYEQPDRLSEFIGIDDTDKDSTYAELTEIYNRAHAAYQTRTRDGLLWQTMHSVVYGLNGMEHLWCQENWGVDFVSKGGGGEFEQVQSDWNQNDDTRPDYIKNKPTIPDVSGLATKTELNQGLSEKQNTIDDIDDIRQGAAAGATAVQPSALDDYRTSSAQEAIDEAIQGDIVAIENKIPSQATSANQLADKDFVNSSLNSITAFYITKDAQGTQFATKAQLDSTTTFYSGGEVRVPTRNDYCIVLADETKTDPVTRENPTTRYIYQNGWEFQYIVNKTTLTAAQLAAINSGITSGKVTQYDEYATGKQDTINDLETIRSGAESGAAAYQKPSTGIPATDLAAGVIPDITYDLAFLSLDDNTTSFNFPANQQCHRKVRIVASATLNFAVENKACNYVRVYNSGASEITLTIGTVTHNGTSVSLKVGPAEIKCGVGKYVEISVIYDGSDATFTASDDLQVLN